MLTQLNVYVAEQTRQPEELRQAENHRLARQAERARQGGQRAISRLLIRSGEALLTLGCRMQEEMDGNCGQNPAPGMVR